MGIRFGGVIILACAFVAFVLLVAGLPTPVYKSKPGYRNGATTKITPFKYKVKGQPTVNIRDTSRLCDALRYHFVGVQVFGVISTIFAGLTAAVGAAGAFLQMPQARFGVLAGAGASVLTSVFAMIAWAMAAAPYNQRFCGSQLKSDFDYGPTIGLWITAWLLLLGGGIAGGAVGFIVDKVMEGGAGNEAEAQPQSTPQPDMAQRCDPHYRSASDARRVAELEAEVDELRGKMAALEAAVGVNQAGDEENDPAAAVVEEY